MRLASALMTLVVFCAFSGQAFALTDDDYRKFIHESPAFAKADARLNAVWRQLKGGLSKQGYQGLLEEQRLWLKQRDAAAQAAELMDNRRPLVEVYSAETLKRAEALEARFNKEAGVTAERAPAQPAAARTSQTRSPQGHSSQAQAPQPQSEPVPPVPQRTQSLQTVKGTFTGFPQLFNEIGMLWYRLVDAKGQAIVMVGAVSSLSPQARECLDKAKDGLYQVEVTGTAEVFNDGTMALREEGLRCKKH